MAIEHKNLPESGLHEPKGISLAPSNRVYKSNGTGSGSWSLVDANTLQGTLNNTIPAGRRVETDGSGGFSAQVAPANAYGTMNLTDNATSQAITAAVDPTLQTNSDYQAITIAVSYESLRDMTSGANSLVVNTAGLYIVNFWANIKSSNSNSLIGIKFVVNGTDFVARAPKQTIDTVGELRNISGNGVHTFAEGDDVKMYIASSTSSNITVECMTFQMVYLGAF